ncbi:hypothetical protein V6N13_124271 [Hibiscus sabdariffa]|uniref:Uncharacterized protein n=1 Tax=Hibiscus sabdariffa TaxID=183260 RepID=A0ABR2S1Q1_9ROSI
MGYTGNVELLGYGQHKVVYYRDPSSDFKCDGLVLIHNDETVRQVVQLLVMKGIVDIYVDHKLDDNGSPKTNDGIEVNVEGVARIEGSYDLEPDIEVLEAAGEDLRTIIEEFDDIVPKPVINGGPKEVAGGFDLACDGGPNEAVDGGDRGSSDAGGPKEVVVDGFDLACDGGLMGVVDGGDGGSSDDGEPKVDVDGLRGTTAGGGGGPRDTGGRPSGVSENVISEDFDENVDSYSTTEEENDDESFLHNIEITSDEDGELVNIRRNLRSSKRREKTMVDESNEDTDYDMVGDDVVDENRIERNLWEA